MSADIEVEQTSTGFAPSALSPQPKHRKTIRSSSDSSCDQPSALVIFDWDDTLLSSTYLTSKGVLRLDAEVPPEVELQLKTLEASVINLLTMAVEVGPVYIVSNSEKGWVQLSAKKFLPGVVPLLDNENIHILSARTKFEKQFPASPSEWKRRAFQEIIDETMISPKNLVSFGDSNCERECILSVGKQLTTLRTKSIKFIERPTLDQLRTEIDLIINCLSQICSYDFDLDLMLTVSSLPTAN